MDNLFGRAKIFTTLTSLDENNVVAELNKVLSVHFQNMAEEEYLYWYRRGLQPVLDREKQIRSDINNKIVQNVASEIVAFKNGYFLTKPTFYVDRTGKKANRKVKQLNDYLYASGKHEADNNIVDWFHTVGLGVLFVDSMDDEDTPVKTYALDPRQAFVVYSRRAGNEPVYAVHIAVTGGKDKDKKNEVFFDVFTKEKIFHLRGGLAFNTHIDVPATGTAQSVESVEINALGEIPIIEYAYDRNRMSSFETVLPLLDAINNIQSDRENGVEQFIQSLMVLTNCTLGEDEAGNPITAEAIRRSGLIELKSNSSEGAAKVDILSEQLDQTQTQVLIDDLLQQVCNISGMPFTSKAGTSDSSNNGAIYLRNGWSSADTYARNTEDIFKEANKNFDKLFVKILKQKNLIDIKASEIDIQFTRNEMENLLVKTQGAMNLKELGLSPELVLEKAGISNDPVGDVAKSKPYIEAAFTTKEDKEQQGVTDRLEANREEGELDGTDNNIKPQEVE